MQKGVGDINPYRQATGYRGYGSDSQRTLEETGRPNELGVGSGRTPSGPEGPYIRLDNAVDEKQREVNHAKSSKIYGEVEVQSLAKKPNPAATAAAAAVEAAVAVTVAKPETAKAEAAAVLAAAKGGGGGLLKRRFSYFLGKPACSSVQRCS